MILIKNTVARLIQLGNDANLVPGVNPVDEAIWNQYAKLPVVQHYLEEGILEEAGKMDNSDSLRSMKQAAAIALVQETMDKSLLRRWESDETRAPVLKTIVAQTAKIDKQAAPTKKTQE
jgi:hypothetical protein